MAGELANETVTPGGIGIKYFPPPDRHYEICCVDDCLHEGCKGSEFIKVPGVTEVLDVLDKKALVWWGMEIGAVGVQTLLNKGYSVSRMSQKELTEALTREKITVNHVRNQAGDRGKAVHDAFETWAVEGILPDPGMFAEEERGYVEGLNAFLTDCQPNTIEAEVMVGSLNHGFAGRYDARLEITKPCEVVYKLYPKRKPLRAILRPGVILVDLKTSAHVYPTHHLQIEAYEGASIESGYGTSDYRGILRVSKEGKYEFVRSKSSYNGFLAVRQVYEELKGIK